MTTQTYVVCPCCKMPAGYYCKAWDGKRASSQNLITAPCDKDPETCEYLVESKKREGCEWIWQTISSSPKPEAEAEVISKVEAEEVKKTTKQASAKQSNLTCVECGEPATHKIKGYRPTPVCILHAEEAKADGYELEEIEHA